MQNLIAYSTRDYLALINQINANPVLAELPEYIKNLVAAPFDVLNNTLNGVYNSLLKDTSFSRTHLQDLLALIDYQMRWKRTSSTPLDISINPAATASSSYTITKDKLTFRTNDGSDPLIFESRTDITFPMGTSTGSVIVYQQETQPEKKLGDSNGSSWQVFETGYIDMIEGNEQVIVDAAVYTRVYTFARSKSTDKHYKLYFRSDGSSYVKFGGITTTGLQRGFIPPNGSEIFINAAIGGGIKTIKRANTITEYIGDDINIQTATNPLQTTGGSDEESIESAKENSELNLYSDEVFINVDSGRNICKKIVGVYDVLIVKAGLLQVDVYIIPDGWGYPSPALKTTVADKLVKSTILEEVAVTPRDPNYYSLNIGLNVKLLPNYAMADVEKFIALAAVLRTTELGRYINDVYLSSDFTSVVALLNSLFLYMMPYQYDTVVDKQQLIRLLDNTPYQTFQDKLVPQDIGTAVQGFVYGIDYVEITNPSAPVLLGTGQTIRPIAVTITQI